MTKPVAAVECERTRDALVESAARLVIARELADLPEPLPVALIDALAVASGRAQLAARAARRMKDPGGPEITDHLDAAVAWIHRAASLVRAALDDAGRASVGRA
jgi:hypothetical protein